MDDGEVDFFPLHHAETVDVVLAAAPMWYADLAFRWAGAVAFLTGAAAAVKYLFA